ncbi:MAG: sugar ABC transporter permease [Lachnospiraceae bacterium]|nr:sugar ABC transporter permease [Lachnospiraceae bacterium]
MEKALRKYAPLFVLPTFAAFLIGFVYPFIQGLYLSFCQFTTIKNAKFIGLGNYVKVFQDASFLDAFWFTALFAIVSVLSINIIAFTFALILTRDNLKGTNIFRTVFFMPNLIGGIVLGYIWQILINCVLSLVAEPLLALNTTAGYWGLIILMCWQQIGYMMIIYIAGIQNVPEALTEAAAIDGATAWETLIKVKLPMVMPSITICVFLTLTNSFKLFDQNLALTAGEPAHATEMLALNIYNTFYARAGAAWKGIGQAKAVIFCIMVIVISLIQFRATHSKEVQQ